MLTRLWGDGADTKNLKCNQSIITSPLFLFFFPLFTPFFFSFPFFAGLGGCMKGLTIRSDETNPPVSQSVNLSVASRRSVRVYLDGCPTSESRFNCRGNDSVLVYSGRRTEATDYSLQPFTGNNVQFKYTTTQTQTPELPENILT